MRINVLQHTPSEGPGAIQEWATLHQHEMFIYHPYQFGILPKATETDLLIILGGPMSPNDDLEWIKQERELIHQLLQQHKPIFGACYGAQQITKVLGCEVLTAPHKEVGWAPVYRQNDVIPGLPEQLTVLHWHEEMFQIPRGAELLFSSNLVANQGFCYNGNVVGLQFHLEPQLMDVRTMAINDGDYADVNNDLHQTATEIAEKTVPVANKAVIFTILDYIAS